MATSLKAIKTNGKYFLYNIDGHLELWRGQIDGEWSFRAGYVTDKDNFELATVNADEEMAYLMAQDA